MLNSALLFVSFFAGIMTVLAPCVLPLLPVIIGSSFSGKDKFKPFWVILGLILSVIIFTILLKSSTILINIDPIFWKIVSGGILVILGLFYIFPQIWEGVSVKLNLSDSSNKFLATTSNQKNWIGDILTGGALGPVFSSCSPTYSLIIATILPADFGVGLVYIFSYSLGLGLIMLAIALFGRNLIIKLRGAASPDSWFKKVLGIIFLLIGVAIITGFDKIIETQIIQNGGVDWLIEFENRLLDKTNI